MAIEGRGARKPFVMVPRSTKAPRSSPCAKAWCGAPRAAHAFRSRSNGDNDGLGGVLGGAGTPLLKRGSKRRTFRWRDEARCRRTTQPGGIANGRRASGPPFAKYAGVVPPHYLHSAKTVTSGKKMMTSLLRGFRLELVIERDGILIVPIQREIALQQIIHRFRVRARRNGGKVLLERRQSIGQ
jgi:hypothetical protein